MYSLSGKRVWVAGHRGMVGSAIELNDGIMAACRWFTDNRLQMPSGAGK